MCKKKAVTLFDYVFKSIKDKGEPFLITFNKDYEVGEVITLNEYRLGEASEGIVKKWSGYTRRTLKVKITHLRRGGLSTKGSGLRKDWVILGIKIIEEDA